MSNTFSSNALTVTASQLDSIYISLCVLCTSWQHFLKSSPRRINCAYISILSFSFKVDLDYIARLVLIFLITQSYVTSIAMLVI